MAPWEQRAANATHVLLYVLFLAAPLTGWLFSSAAGSRPSTSAILPIPDLLQKDRALADVLRAAHSGSTTRWPR
jgi:cytochrome b561